MISRTTHIFKKVDNLDLKLDIIVATKPKAESSTAVFFIHGCGLVAYDRNLLPPHIAQSCLKRGWPLITADYRLLPQASARDMVDDVLSAYEFVQTNLASLLGEEKKYDIIVMGSSAGTYLSYVTKPLLQPPPIAIFNFYGPPTCDDPFYCSNHVIGPAPIPKAFIESFLSEPVTTGYTPRGVGFDTASLLPDFSVDPEWKPSPPEEAPARASLYFYYVQESKFPEMVQDADPGWESSAWKDFGPVIAVHGDKDTIVPYYMSEKIAKIMGPENMQLFTATGEEHGFDSRSFLGDPVLGVVEKAWNALDEIVAKVKS